MATMTFETQRGSDGKVRAGVWDRICVPGRDEKDGQRTEFTVDTLSQMVANFEERGDLIPIDHNHQSNYAATNGQPAPALGFYGALAVVEGGKVVKLGKAQGVEPSSSEGMDGRDGLWAFRSEVTPLGQELLPNFRLLSPTFIADGTRRDGTSCGYCLLAVAATNTPWQSQTKLSFEREAAEFENKWSESPRPFCDRCLKDVRARPELGGRDGKLYYVTHYLLRGELVYNETPRAEKCPNSRTIVPWREAKDWIPIKYLDEAIPYERGATTMAAPGERVKCPKCNQRVKIGSDGKIEKHVAGYSGSIGSGDLRYSDCPGSGLDGSHLPSAPGYLANEEGIAMATMSPSEVRVGSVVSDDNGAWGAAGAKYRVAAKDADGVTLSSGKRLSWDELGKATEVSFAATDPVPMSKFREGNRIRDKRDGWTGTVVGTSKRGVGYEDATLVEVRWDRPGNHHSFVSDNDAELITDHDAVSMALPPQSEEWKRLRDVLHGIGISTAHLAASRSETISVASESEANQIVSRLAPFRDITASARAKSNGTGWIVQIRGEFSRFASTDSLKARIAKALGWSEQDVNSTSLASLRDLVRPVDAALASEISRVLQGGGHLFDTFTDTDGTADGSTKGDATMNPKQKLAAFMGARFGLKFEAEPDDKKLGESASKCLEGEALKAATQPRYDYSAGADSLEEMARLYEESNVEPDGDEEKPQETMRRMAAKFRKMAAVDGQDAAAPPELAAFARSLGLESRGKTAEQIMDGLRAVAVPASKVAEAAKLAAQSAIAEDREQRAAAERKARAAQLMEQLPKSYPGDRESLRRLAERDPDEAAKLAAPFMAPGHLFDRFTANGSPIGKMSREEASMTPSRTYRTPFGQFVVEDDAFAAEIERVAFSQDPVMMSRVDALVRPHERQQKAARLIAAEKLVRRERPELAAGE